MRKALVIGGVVASLAAVNVGIWLTVLQPAAGAPDPLWDAMATVTIPGQPDAEPVFPAALREREGTRISLTGVAFATPSGTEGDAVRWCVLMPPSRYGCCGISCDPRPESSIYVDCAATGWPAPGRQQALVTVEGTLHLDRTAGSWCLYTLADASVRLMEP